MRVRKTRRELWLVLCNVWLCVIIGISGCSENRTQNIPSEVVKIGLIAPFEGRYREIGVDVIPAARLAIQEWASRPESRHLAIELVAYDDRGDQSTAREQALRLVNDPSVEVAIGHWLEETTNAALPRYADRDMPLIAVTSIPDDYTGKSFSFRSYPENAAEIERALEATSSSEDVRSLQVFKIDRASASSDIVSTETRVLTGDSRIVTRQVARLLGDEFTRSAFLISSERLPDMRDDSYWDDDAISAFRHGFEANSLGASPGIFSRNAYDATWLAIRWIAQDHGIALRDTPVDHIKNSDQLVSDLPYFVYRWENDHLVVTATIP